MAASIQDHCHVDTDNPPTAEYNVGGEGFNPDVAVPMQAERGLDGSLHVHRLLDGSGDPKPIWAHRITLLCTLAQKNTVVGLQGKACYYTEIYHDAAAHANNTRAVYFRIRQGGLKILDPMGEWWTVSLDLLDNSL